jgi:glycosyltransferase involved in cell wall biosynthesis
MVKMETRKIRVCFISPKAYPLFNPAVESVFGGAEVDLYLLATELAKDERFAVSFIVADYGQPEEEVREGVRILRSVNFRRNPLAGALAIWKAMKQADADWYILESASPGVPLGVCFARLHRRKLLYRTASQTECNGAYLNAHPLLGRVFLYALHKADLIITQNQQDRDNLQRLFKLDSSVIANGHRIPESIAVEKDTILWVGRSAAVKGPQRFVELAKQLPEEKFVMVCQRATGDEHYDELKADAAAVENLTFVERAPFAEVDRYFERAMIFVNTSDSEGFPNTFIQACKAGAAILSRSVNPDSFLDACQCGISCGGDDVLMFDQLRDLLKNKHYLELGRNGRKEVAAKHDLAVIIERYKELFEEQA